MTNSFIVLFSLFNNLLHLTQYNEGFVMCQLLFKGYKVELFLYTRSEVDIILEIAND